MKSQKILLVINSLMPIAKAIINGKKATVQESEVVLLLSKGFLKSCPRANAFLTYAREVYESRDVDSYQFSKVAEGAKEHQGATQCLSCQLLFDWFMAHNGKQTESEKQIYELIFARQIQKLAQSLL